eukprot:CAMPEP_0204067764 /NCGR_PEP_ID=MMETSP0360-20130528/154098_1 /ASSEMBLY_ACC=CAM_ASM_000342 /TAXON_ID=268821 /ORGANISM="Scrippsiella Hangoei, Strain SHTV-5" /LENGTH=58 /DNA_ID=CAMNT_0051015859 /DNA_START=18 /DNA_END=192 /DNA_ORIENTATION=-
MAASATQYLRKITPKAAPGANTCLCIQKLTEAAVIKPAQFAAAAPERDRGRTMYPSSS